MTDVRSRNPAAPSTRPSELGGDGPLVEAIAAGDQSALSQAYLQHASRVHAVARGVCGDMRAEDLTQEIFLQLWNNPHRYDARRGSLRTYLLVQAHSRAVDALRRDSVRNAREAAENALRRTEERETDAAELDILRRAEVGELVAALPEVERHAIVLAYFGGHTYRDVARLLDVPEGTIKSRIRTGLTRLRAERSASIDLT